MAVKFHPGNLPKVGDLVYYPFAILKPAKVISIVKKTSHPKIKSNIGREIEEIVTDAITSMGNYDITIKFLDGHTEVANEWQLSDYNHATDEHLKKYNNLDAVRQKLKALK